MFIKCIIWLLFIGIGLMIAQSLESNGAIVYILGRRQDTLDTAAKTAVSLKSYGEINTIPEYP